MGLSTLSFISDIQGRYYRDSDQTTQ
jgi:hypothetical protein